MYTCLFCSEKIDVELDWDTDEVVCPHCEKIMIVFGDEWYDPDTGDCDYWFYLEKP